MQKPQKGCSSLGLRLAAGEGGAERTPIDTLRRRRRVQLGGKARERRRSEISVQAFVAGPRGANPKGASGDARVNHTFRRQGLPEGLKPRNRNLSSRPAPRCGYTARRNGRWVLPLGKRGGYLPGRRKLRRVNPMSAAGAKQNRRGSRGVNRQEGNQTLKADRSGQAKPVKKWTRDS